MKKILVFLVLNLMFWSSGNSKEMLSIEEYYKQNKKTDPATLVYIGNRCSALFLLNHDLLQITDKEIAESYMRASSKTSFFAGEVLMLEFGHTQDQAIKSSFENVLKMRELYQKDAENNYIKTGKYMMGSYLEEDVVHCQKFYKLVDDWIHNKLN